MIDREEIARILARDDRIEAAYLLGSAVEDRLRADSDVDIAVLPIMGQRIDDISRVSLATELFAAAGRTVDIGVLSSSNLVYARQAILTGIRIYVRDRTSADEAAARFMGMYAFFNEERAEVLRTYRM